ncbi:MAG: hypothetical protein ACE5E6_04015 [Phycisphaerae bacterium]
MVTIRSRLVTAGLVWVVAGAAGAAAGTWDVPGGARRPQPDGQYGYQQEGGKRRVPPAGRAPGFARREMNTLKKLQQMMRARLGLAENQVAAIDAHFEAYFRESAARAGADADVRELRSIRQEIRDAQAAGHDAEVKTLRQRLLEFNVRRREERSQALEGLLEKVRGELSEDQATRFAELVGKLRLRVRDDGGDPVRRLMRAVMHPDVKLSAAQRDKLRDIMRGAFGRDRADRRDAQALAALRDRIMAELTPEQRSIVETRLEQLRARADQASKAPRRKPKPDPVDQGANP